MTKLKITNLGIKFNLDKKRDMTLKNKILKPFRKSKRKEFWALRNINLELKPGDILGITGPNGSGKSTLLRSITGIYDADEGKIEVEGKISLLAIGAGFEADLTGIENIYLNGSIFGMTKKEIDEKLKQIIEFADIGEFVYQPIRTYSSGMASRLGFAIAINLNPDILLIDEVMAVGDKEFKEKCKKEINKMIRNKNKIVLIVSHNLILIKEFCNNIMFLKKGQIEKKLSFVKNESI